MLWQIALTLNLAKRLVPRRIARAIRPYSSTPENDRRAVEQAREMIARLATAGINVNGLEVLEIGSGWLPTVPTIFAAHGASRVVLTDVVRLADSHTWEIARNNVAANAPDLTIPAPLPFDYRAPTDLTDIESASVDLVISRAVLEHITVEDLPSVLAQCRRVLRDGGWMCHSIDHTDHRAHLDRSLSFVDFLRYPDWQWGIIDRLWDSHQNRLRSSEFTRYFLDAGFEILDLQTHTNHERAFEVKYSDKYNKYDKNDRLVCTSSLILKKI